MESFDSVPDWINEVSKYTAEDTLKILLVNKSDVDEKEKKIPRELLDVSLVSLCQKFSEETKIPWIETSAKTGVNVDEAFIRLTKQLIEKK